MAEVIGWIVLRDGLRPLWNADAPRLFADYAEAQGARRAMDTVTAVTQARCEELQRRFDAHCGSSDDRRRGEVREIC